MGRSLSCIRLDFKDMGVKEMGFKVCIFKAMEESVVIK